MVSKAPIDDDRWTYLARVVRIIDGDTVVLDIDLGCDQIQKKRTCRLLDIDTPELVGSEREAGYAAKERLRQLLSQADPLLIRTKLDKSGSFRRLLVELWDGDLCINQVLVDEGYAKPYVK